ncbi:MAG: hypothetical protein IJS89_01780 [Bacteroidaceae bacterium]|nr:hypothetical protein [Bacteroidaceae bacterium]
MAVIIFPLRHREVRVCDSKDAKIQPLRAIRVATKEKSPASGHAARGMRIYIVGKRLDVRLLAAFTLTYDRAHSRSAKPIELGFALTLS